MPGATFKRFLLVGAKAARPVIIVAKETLATMEKSKKLLLHLFYFLCFGFGIAKYR